MVYKGGGEDREKGFQRRHRGGQEGLSLRVKVDEIVAFFLVPVRHGPNTCFVVNGFPVEISNAVLLHSKGVVNLFSGRYHLFDAWQFRIGEGSGLR